MRPAGPPPLVSVVMVTCNVERFLGEAIESILSQTFHDFEFIVVDFGSTDSSTNIAYDYSSKDSRIVVKEIAKCGLAAARNAACFLARGRYIAIQDADDVSLPNRLTAEVNFLERYPGFGLIGTAIQRIDGQGRHLTTVNNFPTDDLEIRSKLREWNTFWQPTVVMLREAFVRLGGYRETLPPSEDYDLWLRISEQYKCANLSEILVKYRIHSSQLSIRKRKEQILCALAAQAAASLRQQGKSDPLTSGAEVTPTLLAEMGVSRARQDDVLAQGFLSLVKDIYSAGDYATVPEATAEMLKLQEQHRIDKRLISEVHMFTAKACWKQKRIVPGIFFIGRALVARPGAARGLFRRLLGVFGVRQ